MKKLFLLFPLLIFFGIISNAYATNCVESLTCLPQNPLDVLNLYDVWFGAGFSVMIMALIIGSITMAVYIRTRSLPMLAILGIYEVAAFGSILSSQYVSSQYHIALYVVGMGIASGVVMLILRLVKE